MPRSAAEITTRARRHAEREATRRARALIEYDAAVLLPSLDSLPPRAMNGYLMRPRNINSVLDFLLSDTDRRAALRTLLAVHDERDGVASH